MRTKMKDIAIYKSFAGKSYDNLKVLSYNEDLSNKWKYPVFDCECKLCGNTCHISLNDLTSRNRTDCGCVKKMEVKMPNIDLTNHEFGALIVKEFDPIRTRKLHKSCWICECKLCGNKRSIQERELLAGKEDCGCQKKIKMAETKRKKILARAEAMIGQMNVTSEILSINEDETKKRNMVMLNLRCGSCGNEYVADFHNVERHRYKLCPNCSQKGVNNCNFKDYTGQMVGDYKVNELISFDKHPPIWECTNIISGETVQKDSDQLYKILYKNRPRKIPFTFVSKD